MTPLPSNPTRCNHTYSLLRGQVIGHSLGVRDFALHCGSELAVDAREVHEVSRVAGPKERREQHENEACTATPIV